MTILFYTRFRPVNEKGGTEHTTQVIADGLKRLYGIRSIAIWQKYANGNLDAFYTDYQIPSDKKDAIKKVVEIIVKHNISCVIVQGYFHDAPSLRDAVSRVKGCHIVFAHHFAPGWEKLSRENVYKKWIENKGLKKLRYRLKLFFFPIFKLQSKINLIKRYFLVYRQAEKVVLLSEHYIKPFQQLALTRDASKFIIIPNAMPYPIMNKASIQKEHIVLMVTRLDERQKRIKLALRIWKTIKENNEYADWKLVVIGEGYNHDSITYQQWAKDNDVPQVFFLGRMNPLEYYKKASVFMMTSLCEGLPLTLLESRSAYVVPLAFNTFGAVYDIIHDGKDGYIINEGDTVRYVTCMRQLMNDEQLRIRMANASIESLHPFTQEKIMEKWYNLLISLDDRFKRQD